jgi:hypothetical protein
MVFLQKSPHPTSRFETPGGLELPEKTAAQLLLQKSPHPTSPFADPGGLELHSRQRFFCREVLFARPYVTERILEPLKALESHSGGPLQ